MIDGLEPKWVDVGGVPTRYIEAGRGEPILLITGGNLGHRGTPSIIEAWERNIGDLSKYFRPIAVDKLGMGYTGNPKADDDYSMQAMVQHLADFIRVLNLERVHVVGQSRGAMAAVALAIHHPERVASCTIVNTSTLAPGIGLNEVANAGCPYPPGTEEAIRWSPIRGASEYSKEFLDKLIDVWRLPKYQESCRKMEDEGLKLRRFVPELAKLKIELLERIANKGIGRPTQVIWGANDPSATLDRGLSLFQLIAQREKDVDLTVINNAKHHPFREHPDHFNALLRGFITSLH